jgi:hypothetical protein
MAPVPHTVSYDGADGMVTVAIFITPTGPFRPGRRHVRLTGREDSGVLRSTMDDCAGGPRGSILVA